MFSCPNNDKLDKGREKSSPKRQQSKQTLEHNSTERMVDGVAT